jgi:hypothetical protein
MKARSVVWGAVASTGMAAFYVAVIVWANGWSHLSSQIAQDWYFLILIIAGFGVQVALMVELRIRHRMRPTEAAAGGAGAGSAAAGMLACCAHHVVEVAPFVGATGAVAFLANYRVAFMVAGIALNAVGITIAARRIRHTPVPVQQESAACVAA